MIVARRGKLNRFWLWCKEPFVTKVDIHDRTVVFHRAFPYKLKVLAAPQSVQDLLNQGGFVSLTPGTIHITDPVSVFSGTTLADMHFKYYHDTFIDPTEAVSNVSITRCRIERG